MIRAVTVSLALLVATVVPVAVAGQPAPAASQELGEILRIEPNLARGAQLYAPCVACHGPDGTGTAEGNVPVIAEQHQRLIAKQLVDYRHAERWDVRMEEVVKRHNLATPRDIADLSGYVSALPRDRAQGTGNGQHVERGRRLYLRDCATCHGAEAEGNGVLLVPRLAGQHYRYLLRQLHDTLEERRPNMPPPHPQLFAPLDVDDLTGMADYLSRVKPARHLAR